MREIATSAPASPRTGTQVGVRVVVTGMAGAGKSTFARALAARTGLPLIHLDLHAWRPGWVRVPADEFAGKQRALLAGERWIVDSNDVDTELLIRRADTLIVLATPWWLCAWRAFRRGIRRPRHTQLPEGCNESTRQRLADEWGIVWRNWRQRHSVPERDRTIAAQCAGVLRVHILHSPRESGAFIDGV